MNDFWILFRFKLSEWMLLKAMDVMPRGGLRNTLKSSIDRAYDDKRGSEAGRLPL